MKTKKYLAVIVGLLLLAGPVLLHQRLSAKDTRFDEVVNEYECHADKCTADFNGDGVMGRLERTKYDTAAPSNRSLIVVDGERELLRLPYRYIDGTWRTHAAILNEDGKSRLLIFDGTDGTRAPVRAVYAWNGREMVQVQPADVDYKILLAMAARDDAGTWDHWSLYRTLSLPLLVAYYLLLTGIVIGFMLRHKFWSDVSHLR